MEDHLFSLLLQDTKDSKQVMANTQKKQPKITLYDKANLEGRSKTFTGADDNLVDSGFYDCASSVKVEAGVWVLYQKVYYKGHVCVVMEGDKINLKNVRPKDKDMIVYDYFDETVSSLKPLEGDFTEEPKITVYAGDFRSRSVEFTKDVLDLKWYNMNDQISYLEVHSGAWIGFEAVNFRSFQTLYLPGKHVLSSTEGKFRNDTLSSLRAIQIVQPVMPVIVDKIEFHLDRTNHKEIPVTVFSWKQKNNTSSEQKLSITKDKSIRREDTYEFRWNQGTKVSVNVSHKLAVPTPTIGFTGGPETTVSLGIESWYDIGSTKENRVAKEETWKVHYPTSIAPKTELTLTSTITESNLDVPFTATLHQGDKKWTETGFH
ncbi:CRYB [Mytilus coruscus]|uniref:CRYB n=1 Tax=Mytilus coruscus TaxID=42192 RepID=A0A6J8CXV5_MYTCO|nr:CRYB [Mytilus coruscus]